MTTMAVPDVLAGAVVAQEFLGDIFPDSSVFTGHHFHVADFSSPTWGTIAVVLVLVLNAGRAVLARLVRAPVDVHVATLTSVSVGAVTSVVMIDIVMTSSAVQARRTVALVYSVLTVRTSVTWLANTGVAVDSVETFSAVHATTGGAVVVVCLTVYSREA